MSNIPAGYGPKLDKYTSEREHLRSEPVEQIWTPDPTRYSIPELDLMALQAVHHVIQKNHFTYQKMLQWREEDFLKLFKLLSEHGPGLKHPVWREVYAYLETDMGMPAHLLGYISKALVKKATTKQSKKKREKLMADAGEIELKQDFGFLLSDLRESQKEQIRMSLSQEENHLDTLLGPHTSLAQDGIQLDTRFTTVTAEECEEYTRPFLINSQNELSGDRMRLLYRYLHYVYGVPVEFLAKMDIHREQCVPMSQEERREFYTKPTTRSTNRKARSERIHKIVRPVNVPCGNEIGDPSNHHHQPAEGELDVSEDPYQQMINSSNIPSMTGGDYINSGEERFGPEKSLHKHQLWAQVPSNPFYHFQDHSGHSSMPPEYLQSPYVEKTHHFGAQGYRHNSETGPGRPVRRKYTQPDGSSSGSSIGMRGTEEYSNPAYDEKQFFQLPNQAIQRDAYAQYPNFHPTASGSLYGESVQEPFLQPPFPEYTYNSQSYSAGESGTGDHSTSTRDSL